MHKSYILIIVSFLALNCCRNDNETSIQINWENSIERPWLGSEVWAVPLEDWSVDAAGAHAKLRTSLWVTDGGFEKGSQVKTLYMMAGKLIGGSFSTSTEVEITTNQEEAYFGIELGHKWEEADDRSVVNRHKRGLGIMATLSATGNFRLGEESVQIQIEKGQPYEIKINGVEEADTRQVQLTAVCTNKDGVELASLSILTSVNNVMGVVSIDLWAPNKEDKKGFNVKSWQLKGESVIRTPKNQMGPVFWSMYSLNEGVMKLSAQFFPLGKDDNHEASLEVKSQDGLWQSIGKSLIDSLASIVLFRVENWNDTIDHEYRIVYNIEGQQKDEPYFYSGIIRKDPREKEVIRMGVANCTKGQLFPYTRTIRNLKYQNPDIMVFSGDQLYEDTNEYGLIRAYGNADDQTIRDSYLNYLGKLAHWGWSFRELMRDRPSIILTDDHDVYQGNLWGESGKHIYDNLADHNKGGYSHHPVWINAVQKAQMSHNPDPYDPTVLNHNISVHYCDFKYGGVSFAVLEDRKFKSGPNGKVNYWEGRPDHIKDDLIDFDPKSIDLPELELLGERQLNFLNDWLMDWKDVMMKCVLSQTIFANIATHHGRGERLLADLDSNAWPQRGRNKAVATIRKAFAPQIAGDQHLPSLIQYGVSNWNDASYAFTAPAIATGYPRRWLVDDQLFVNKTYELDNTGEYKDGLGNIVSVHAVGNPDSKTGYPNLSGKSKFHDVEDTEAAYSSGYGIVDFDKNNQTYTFNAYRLKSDAAQPKEIDQFLGFPKTIHIDENFQGNATMTLMLVVNGATNKPVVALENDESKELIYVRRFAGSEIKLPIYGLGAFQITVSDPERNIEKKLKWTTDSDVQKLVIDLE